MQLQQHVVGGAPQRQQYRDDEQHQRQEGESAEFQPAARPPDDRGNPTDDQRRPAQWRDHGDEPDAADTLPQRQDLFA